MTKHQRPLWKIGRQPDISRDTTFVEMDLLRFTTAGSVDDGKSTLIGRLLYDSKSIMDDQYAAIERSSKSQGEIDLAFFTDGLRAEREQGITIDVAYRYFSTPKRKFIIADTPGHDQYTRNMVTGASTADLAIILIDVRNGVLTQSKRHAFISSLLGIQHLLVAINKMDLLGFDEKPYNRIVEEYSHFLSQLDIQNVVFIPISALEGDNVVDRSERMPWYAGGPLLNHLETVSVSGRWNSIDFRFPVQLVNRPHPDFRGFSGQVVSGTISLGQEVMVLPSRKKSKIKSIVTFDGELEKAVAGDSVTITLVDELDVSRGDMIVRSRNLPSISNGIDADLCWMNDEEMSLSKKYLIQLGTRLARVFISRVIYRMNVDTLHRENSAQLGLNDIGRVELTSSLPLFIDPYKLNPPMGSFILIDPATNATVAAGMIRGRAKGAEPFGRESSWSEKSFAPIREGLNISRDRREAKQSHKAAVLWLTGYSGSGKSSIGRALEEKLFEAGAKTMLLDGDHIRHGLSVDLGFSASERSENIRRVGEVSRLFYEQGSIVICTFISPFQTDRDFVRSLFPEGSFIEVFVNTPLSICIERDPKGLYKKALAGEIVEFTGVSSAYEAPIKAEIVLGNENETISSSVSELTEYLETRHLI